MAFAAARWAPDSVAADRAASVVVPKLASVAVAVASVAASVKNCPLKPVRRPQVPQPCGVGPGAGAECGGSTGFDGVIGNNLGVPNNTTE